MADAERDENRVTTLLAVDSSDGLTPLKAEITQTTGRLRVDTLITGDDATPTDVDDDDIAKAQSLPLIINENYIFDKSGDNWNRMQGSTDGYQFVRPIGIFDSAGHEVDINTSSQILTAPYGEYDRYAQDASTETLITTSYAHHELHSGSSFVCTDLRNVSTTTFKWQVTTPAGTKYAHMIFDINCTGEMTTLITEGSDRVDGTALVELNRRRVGTPTVATVIVTHTPTGGATDGTVVLLTSRSGATAAGARTVSGGSARGNNEFILKPATKYVISVTTYADVWVSLDLDWYEHTDKN